MIVSIVNWFKLKYIVILEELIILIELFMNRKIIITGATGLIGKRLAGELIRRKEHIIIFTRDIVKGREIFPDADEVVEWDYRKTEIWLSKLNGVDAVIHLAGANINGKRWTESYKQEIYDSRIISTRNLVKAIEQSENRPEIFICASGINYYGNKGEKILDENSEAGNDFLADVCKQWESEAAKVENSNVRRVSIRTSPGLSTEEGALKEMLLPFKFFVGGPLGNGDQWFSWVHIEDLVRVYIFALDYTQLKGPVNVSSPNPVRMKEFAKTLGNVLHRPSLFKVPEFVLKIVAGEVTHAIIASMRIKPQKLLDAGFEFKFENLDDAVIDLLKRK